MEILVAIFGFIALAAAVIFYNTFSWGYVCFKFYSWFVLPIFAGLPALTFWQCVGLMFFISLFKNHNIDNSKENESDSDKAGRLVMFLIMPWAILLIASFFK